MISDIFIDKFFNFNISKDFFRFGNFSVPLSSYAFIVNDKILFFKKGSYFVFFRFFTKIKGEFNLVHIIRLFLKGVGYKILRAKSPLYNTVYRFDLGFSVIRYVNVPKSVYTKHRRDRLLIFGFSRDFVVRSAKMFINLRRPDVYKGKGVRDAAYIFEPKPGKQRL